VCVCESESVCVCVCMCERERGSVCGACVCVCIIIMIIGWLCVCVCVCMCHLSVDEFGKARLTEGNVMAGKVDHRLVWAFLTPHGLLYSSPGNHRPDLNGISIL